MPQASRKPPLPLLQLVLLVVVAPSIWIGCSASERHDEVTASPPAAPNSEMKCTCSPCGCAESPPPPPPPSPPSPEYPTSYCPPPPPAPYLYVESPPSGNIYSMEPYFYTSGARRSCTAALLPLYVMCGLLALWEFWSL